MKTLDKKYDRKYLPKEFNPKNENELKSIYQNLLDYDIQSLQDLESFLEFWSELAAVVDEAGSLAYVNMTVDTKNKA